MTAIPLDSYWIIVQGDANWIRCNSENVDVVLDGLKRHARFVYIDDLFGCRTYVILDKIDNIFSETLEAQALARQHCRARDARLDELDPEGAREASPRPPWERG